MRRPSIRSLLSVLTALAIGAVLSSCGGAAEPAIPAYTSTYPTTPVAPARVIAQVGHSPITGALYDHWLAISASGLESHTSGSVLVKPITFDPPRFLACIAHLKAKTPQASTAHLKATCRADYTKIKTLTLNLLLTGYWVREDAAARGIAVPESEVEARFEAEQKEQFPTPTAFHKFQEETLQGKPDLMFAIKSQLLTSLLFRQYAKEHKGLSEKAAAAAYEKSLERWKAHTRCSAGYVIKYCREFH